MPTLKPAILFAAALFCANALAEPPSYDGKTPMIEVGPLWFDPAMTAEEQFRVAQDLVEAHTKILAMYGTRLESPRIVWCKTMACVSFFAGSDGRSFANPGNRKRREGAEYAFTFPSLVVTHQAHNPGFPSGAGVLAHEISHIEMRARLRNEPIPAWFNEGVATYISADLDCRPGMRGTENLFKLASNSQWATYTNKYKKKSALTHCQARNEVAAWIAEHGGFAAVLDLLAKRSRGDCFDLLYGRQQELLSTPAAGSSY